MRRTTNQRLAALVVVGGVVLLVYLLWIMQPEHSDLFGAWFSFNLFVSGELSDHKYYTPSPSDPNSQAIIIVSGFFSLSHLSGWLLALRTLLKGWREARWPHAALNFHRISAVLILLSVVIAIAYLLQYMNFIFSDLVLAWLNINFIVAGQHSPFVSVEPDMYNVAQIHTANVTMAAFALSYVLSLVLAAQTLWQGRRTPDTTSE